MFFLLTACTPCTLFSLFALGSVRNPRRDLDPLNDDLGAEFPDVTQPCNEQDTDADCFHAAFDGPVPLAFEFGDGSTREISGDLVRRRRRQTQSTYFNKPLTPETTYCLFVMAEIASGIENVSETCHMC